MPDRMIEVSVDTKGVDRMIARFNPEFASAIRSIYNDGSIIVQREMRLEAPKGVSSRALRETIVYEITEGQAVIHPTKRYGGKWGAEIIERGRMAGRMPPYKDPDFAAWAHAHGIPPFILARSIARKGTRPTWFVRNTYNKTKPQVIKYANVRIGEFTQAMNA